MAISEKFLSSYLISGGPNFFKLLLQQPLENYLNYKYKFPPEWVVQLAIVAEVANMTGSFEANFFLKEKQLPLLHGLN